MSFIKLSALPQVLNSAVGAASIIPLVNSANSTTSGMLLSQFDLRYLPQAIFLATGALPYASAAGVAASLPAGTPGQVLTMSGGLPSWASPGGGLSPWATTTVYAAGNVVTEANTAYYCLVGHTAGTFSTDVQSGYWIPLSLPALNPNLMTANFNFEDNTPGGWTACNAALTNGLPSAVGSGGNAFSSSNGGTAKGANTSAPATTNSSPIDGTYSLNFATTGAGTIGDGYITQKIALSSAYQAKVLTIKFKYKVASGTPALPGTSSNTYACAAYDVTNNSWLSMAGNFNFTQSSGVGDFVGTCQTNLTTAAIQIFIYNPVAPTGASSLLIDNVYIGQQTAPLGPVMGDFNSNLSFTVSPGFGTVSQSNIQSKRVGDSLEVYGSWNVGTVTATTAYLGIPFTIDSSKLNTNNAFQKVGSWTQMTSGSSPIPSSNVTGDIFYDGSTNGFVFFGANVSSSIYQKIAVNACWASGSSISFMFRLPIAGWSSNQVQSSDTDTRVVTAVINQLSSLAVTGGSPILLSNVLNDTHAAYNASTGKYTVPVTGYYDVTINGIYQSGTQGNLYLYKNGSFYCWLCSTPTTLITGGSTQVYCNAGDYLTFVSGSSITLNYGAGQYGPFATITRRSGPAVIAATESVNLSVNTCTSTASASTPFVFTNVVRDSHHAYNTSTGQWTCPVSGFYSIMESVYTNSTAVASIYINGVAVAQSVAGIAGSSGSPTSTQYPLKAGDIVDIRPANTQTALGGSALNNFSIARLGN